VDVAVGAVAVDCEAGVAGPGVGSAGCCAGAGASGAEVAGVSASPAASPAGGGGAGASTPPSIVGAVWRASVATEASCVLSLVTCVSGLAAVPVGAGFGGGTESAGAAADAREAAGAVVAAATFAAGEADGARVEAGLAATAGRRAPALSGCGRSLTITGSLASFAAGRGAATGVTAWRGW
jgi:hypothetical protein